MAINININIIAVHVATARPGVSHVQSYETESTCPTCSASQSPPGALEGGQVHWNSQWTALGDKHTHTPSSTCSYTHSARQSQKQTVSKHWSVCGTDTPENTTEPKQSKTHRHKESRRAALQQRTCPTSCWTGLLSRMSTLAPPVGAGSISLPDHHN